MEYLMNQQSLTRHEIINVLRSRVGFFAIFNLFDDCKRTEMEIQMLRRENEYLSRQLKSQAADTHALKQMLLEQGGKASKKESAPKKTKRRRLS